MSPVVKSFFMGILLLAICAALVHGAIEPAATATDQYNGDAADEKSEDPPLTLHKRPSFFVGSRYGRNNGGANPVSAKTRRLSVVARNDRFFLGSRYGKRSDEFMSPYAQLSDNHPPRLPLQHNVESSNNAAAASPYMLSCVFTGLRNYYRCNSIDEINNIINQLTTAQNDEDDK